MMKTLLVIVTLAFSSFLSKSQQPFEPQGVMYEKEEVFEKDSALVYSLIDSFKIDLSKYELRGRFTEGTLFNYLHTRYKMTNYVLDIKNEGAFIQKRKSEINKHLPILNKHIFIYCLDYDKIGEKYLKIIIF